MSAGLNVSELRKLVGDGTWSWLNLYVDDNDLFCPETEGSMFGDIEDVKDGQDNGKGASGFPIAMHPQYCGVSLPMAHSGLSSLDGSPIPHLPWFITVVVRDIESGKWTYAQLVDLGPSKYVNGKELMRGIDLSVGTVSALGLHKNDLYKVAFRIIGGSQYVKG